MTSTDYSAAIQGARPAQARVGGITRGGFASETEFIFHAGLTPMRVPLDSVSELVIHPRLAAT